jgi:hypothetical protein
MTFGRKSCLDINKLLFGDFFPTPILVLGSQRPNFQTFKEPKNRFQGINSASLCSLADWYDNPIPNRFLAPPPPPIDWCVAQLVARRLAVRQAWVRISARHPSGGPLLSGSDEYNRKRFSTSYILYINIVCMLA